MYIKQLTDFLNEVAPLHYQETYDNAGLIIGHQDQACTGALITLDVTEAILDEAKAKGCNLIIAHHPIIFRGLKRINGNNYVERTVIQAIQNDIAIYAIHTNLDNVLHGVNAMFAEKIGIRQTKILKPLTPDNQQIGAGLIGELTEPLSAPEFLAFVKAQMDLTCIRHTELLDKPIQKVALCGGSGSFLLKEAIRQGADIFISGDFKYHEFFDADGKIVVADIGHYESEQYTKQLIYRFISKKFPNFALHLSEINTNPIKYVT